MYCANPSWDEYPTVYTGPWLSVPSDCCPQGEYLINMLALSVKTNREVDDRENFNQASGNLTASPTSSTPSTRTTAPYRWSMSNTSAIPSYKDDWLNRPHTLGSKWAWIPSIQQRAVFWRNLVFWLDCHFVEPSDSTLFAAVGLYRCVSILDVWESPQDIEALSEERPIGQLSWAFY